MKYLFLSFLLVASPLSFADEVESLKQKLIATAQKFQGQGDPNFKIQNTLQPMVDKLLALNPQPPVADRLPLLEGTWQQVWGPYSYRGDDRGVDPSLKPDEIYQTIFAEGFYYNTNPNMENGKVKSIGLLKGKYKLNRKNPNVLNVRFVKYPGNKTRPENIEIWELPALAESGDLPEKITVVPTWIVKLFFGGGKLNEVYTDHDLRITYGNSGDGDLKNYLYIMTRVD